MSGAFKKLPETEQTMTVKDFAEWLLTLPKEYLNKQIHYIDVSYIYKDKPLNVELTPSGSHVCIEDDHS